MKKYLKKFLIFIVVSILIEICLFNFETIRSKFYTPYDKDLNIYYETNFKDDNGVHILDYSEKTSTIEIYDIDENIENIYVDFEIEGDTQICNVEYLISDEGNEALYLLNNNNIKWYDNLQSTNYTKINSYGKVNSIVIKISKNADELLKVNSISLNKQRPLLISKVRMATICLILFISSLFIGKDNLLHITFKNSSLNYKRATIISIVLIQIFISLSVGKINDDLVNKKYNEQYLMLTDSLINGQVNIDIDVDDRLLGLKNPYDLSQRLESGTEYNHDTAFYKGKYYVYFGVAPVIVYYLPYKLITGNCLPDYTVNIINFIILSISIILLFKKICEKYFNNVPLIIYALITLVAINSSGALSLLSEPRIYTIPILMALTYSCLGLCLWTYSKKENKINNVLAFLGSLAIGIAIASRPQFGLFVFFALIIFFDEIKQLNKYLASFTCAIVPLIIVGGLLMYYNYIRFESPFDFGANYNLTLNDMTHRGFRLDRVGDGLFYYLFQTTSLIGTFPYIGNVTVSSDYVGNLIKEYSFGGLLFIHPYTSFSLLTYKVRNYFKNKKLYIFSLVSILFGLVIIILDTQMAGLLERYFSDFSIYFIFSSILVILSIVDNAKLDKEKLYKILFVLLALSSIYCFLRLFAGTYQTLSECNPRLYYKVVSLFKLN